jgi:hypothetical protein
MGDEHLPAAKRVPGALGGGWVVDGAEVFETVRLGLVGD